MPPKRRGVATKLTKPAKNSVTPEEQAPPPDQPMPLSYTASTSPPATNVEQTETQQTDRVADVKQSYMFV